MPEIDVRELIAGKSVREHCLQAEEYFAQLDVWEHHLAKPFGSIDELPQLLVNLSVIVSGLTLCPGMKVLEFGAGTCWATRILTQLGCRVIACDVSPTALQIGRELFKRHPPFGNRPAPEFLVFDGEHLDLADESVERIICLDALHHVPNPEFALMELGRVLAPGGIAGFAEPGPEHSRTPQSQYEMRTHGVIENNVDVHGLWRAALRAGFTDIKLSIFDISSLNVGLEQFEAFLAGDETTGGEYVAGVRSFLRNQRNFFLSKGSQQPRDSRYRQGLTARIRITPPSLTQHAGQSISLAAEVENNSASIWLPRSADLGGVMLGAHVYHEDGSVFRESYHWEPLTPGNGRSIMPGEIVQVQVQLPPLPPGQYRLDFDMVSNDVCWFAINGSQMATIKLTVV